MIGLLQNQPEGVLDKKKTLWYTDLNLDNKTT